MRADELQVVSRSMIFGECSILAALKEADRLEKMGEQNPEQTWVRNWLDTILDLGWGRTTEDRTDVIAARAVLDADTTGLQDGKDRIVESGDPKEIVGWVRRSLLVRSRM